MLDVAAARALLTETRPARLPDGYPPKVRTLVTALAGRLLADGQTAAQIARQLGLHVSTVNRWLEEEPPMRPTFVPVELSAERPTTEEAGAGLSLVSPGGFRLEGLGLEEAIVALSRLG